ncbi:hypothetical protein BD626DRAFT_494496 [Schizophyllum amplum]|uniref:Allergen protein n=1 Tax=Schizophyllum amplum TaxID=97359 RepID=A0A550CFB1_9AGAR|nr:hypothetical protein BD626DRAFT_494496 [Auriculariopsis ampla]
MFARTIFFACALVPALAASIASRESADNIVYVTDEYEYCMIMPRHKHTDIGDSEHPGGMKTYCSPSAHFDDSQGTLPGDFWTNVAFVSGKGKKGGRTAQLTGCIDPTKVDRLNANDAGGQYDSSGGTHGQGNPQGSVCLGYKHYVELVEPAGNRACLKCCDDPADCPVSMDTSGCPTVIPGDYFWCN